jgi:hypothetical protein
MRANVLIAELFFASTIFAAPFTNLRHTRRHERSRITTRPQNLTDSAKVNGAAGINDVNAEYSSNWAGAVLIGSGYTSVTGSIVVPTPQEPPNARRGTQYAASAWVGIDGDTCGNAIIQTGVDFYIQDGVVSYDAWYEWLPDYAYDFDDFSLGAGDTIQMTVTASSTTAGVAKLENLSTGQSVTHSFSGETDSLCEANAEWIVEDFSDGNSLVPFADFTTVTFTGASAVTDGNTVDTTGATIIDMRQNNRVLTSCSAGGDEVTCTYV